MGHKRKALLWLTLVLLVGSALATTDSLAQRKRERAPARAALDIAKLRGDIANADPLVAQAAADRLATARKEQRADAREALLDALSVGLAPDVAIAALDAVANLGKGGSLDLVHQYLHHRRPDVRATALATLAALSLPASESVVVAALGDRELEVRKAAAELVAQHRLKSGFASLVKLLARGEESVIPSLGMLANAELAQSVADLQEKVPDRLVARALGAMLLNPNFGPDDVRIEVVRVLGGLPGNEAIKALDAYVASVPASSKRESRTEAIEASEKRRNGGGQ